MKNLIWGTILLLLLSIASFATEITVSAVSVPNWQYGGSTAKLRIYAGKQFTTSDGKIVMPGAAATGTGWYKEINCTVVGTTVIIPAIDAAYGYLDSTTDSSVPTASLQAVFFDSQNRKRDAFLTNFRVPHDLGINITWTQILTYNQAANPPPPAGYYTNNQVDQLIAATLTNTVFTSDSRLEDDLSLYGNSLATAVSTLCPSSNCGSTGKQINITSAYTLPGSLTLPPKLLLKISGEGKITLAANAVLTINAFEDPGNRQVFNSSASGAKVLFAKNAVEKIKTVWWTGNTSGASITDALEEALESANANQELIYIPNGNWTSSGGHILGDGAKLECGGGNFPTAAKGTVITLSSPSTTYLFKVAGNTAGVRIRDCVFDGTGTTLKTGLLLQGTYPDTSTDLLIERVTFYNFQYGINLDSLPASEVWQFSQIRVSNSRFLANTGAAFISDSLNSGLVFDNNFVGVPGGAYAFDFAGIGATFIQGGEFACYGSSPNIMRISGAHGIITFQNSQDEGCENWLINNVSDITGTVRLDSNLIQSKIQINQSMTLNSYGNTYLPHTIRIAPGAVPRIVSVNETIRTDAGTWETLAALGYPGTIPVTPLILVKPNGVATNDSILLKQENIAEGYFTTRARQQFLMPSYLEGSPSTPWLSIGAATTIAESKVLLRLGRIDSNQAFDFYYDILRQNSGDDAGRLKFAGNQTGFIGYDFNGDMYVQGALRAQASALIDGATITVDPRAANYHYVTLGGNRTLSMASMSASEQTRADGQKVTVELKQDATGSRTLTLSSGAGQFAFGTDITSVTLTTTASKYDLLTVQYSKRADRWFVIDFKKEF